MIEQSNADLAKRSDDTAPARRRWFTFVGVVAVCFAGALAFVGYRMTRAQTDAGAIPKLSVALASITALPSTASRSATGSERPYLLFTNMAIGATRGHVSLEFLDSRGEPRLVSPLQCDRVHYARDRGICLEAKRGVVTTYHAHVFDKDLQLKHSIPLAGPPSRARVSPDGRLAAVTVFVSGHSYSSPGFSTRTTIIDGETGRVVIDDFESLEVTEAGKVIKAADFNFWGVTFARDGRRFYATLGTAGRTLLIEGDVAGRRAKVIHEDVECPSLSPDNTMIAFKRRKAGDSSGRVAWGLHVLHLATGKEIALHTEVRNVDDQVEWVGNRDIIYAIPEEAQAAAATNIWALRADGSAPPRVFMPLAFSPAAVQ